MRTQTILKKIGIKMGIATLIALGITLLLRTTLNMAINEALFLSAISIYGLVGYLNWTKLYGVKDMEMQRMSVLATGKTFKKEDTFKGGLAHETNIGFIAVATVIIAMCFIIW